MSPEYRKRIDDDMEELWELFREQRRIDRPFSEQMQWVLGMAENVKETGSIHVGKGESYESYLAISTSSPSNPMFYAAAWGVPSFLTRASDPIPETYWQQTIVLGSPPLLVALKCTQPHATAVVACMIRLGKLSAINAPAREVEVAGSDGHHSEALTPWSFSWDAVRSESEAGLTYRSLTRWLTTALERIFRD